MPEASVQEFRKMLLAIGRCADRAVPGFGHDVYERMTGLQRELVQPVTTNVLSKTNEQARNELSQWADRAYTHHQDVVKELREIILVVSTAAESVGDRDRRYTDEIVELTGRLGAIAEGTDLAVMQSSITENTRALKAWVARMAEENKGLVSQLSVQVKEYRTRLAEAEQASNTDPLTQLANRRAFEKHLDWRIAREEPFLLIMIDLDDFKAVNDRYGHAAGDDLLKQFAGEVKAQFRALDMVARLGGDEFVVIAARTASEGATEVERVRKWALGEYKVAHAGESVKVKLTASLGAAAWNGTETASELMARADREVYEAKKELNSAILTPELFRWGSRQGHDGSG
jgi:diguanylate cyclase (GGDEF)-like protein